MDRTSLVSDDKRSRDSPASHNQSNLIYLFSLSSHSVWNHQKNVSFLCTRVRWSQLGWVRWNELWNIEVRCDELWIIEVRWVILWNVKVRWGELWTIEFEWARPLKLGEKSFGTLKLGKLSFGTLNLLKCRKMRLFFSFLPIMNPVFWSTWDRLPPSMNFNFSYKNYLWDPFHLHGWIFVTFSTFGLEVVLTLSFWTNEQMCHLTCFDHFLNDLQIVQKSHWYFKQSH